MLNLFSMVNSLCDHIKENGGSEAQAVVSALTSAVEQVVEALLQEGVHGRVPTGLPVHIAGLALSVSTVLGAQPISVLRSQSSGEDREVGGKKEMRERGEVE